MKKTLLIIISVIFVLSLCACEKKENTVSYDSIHDIQTQQPAVNEPQNEPQAEPESEVQPEKKGVYEGILTEYYGFGKLAAADFELKYGKADETSSGERTTTVVQGVNRFEFNSKGLYYAGISDEAFKGPGGIHCGMTLDETARIFLSDYAASFDSENDEFQSLFGESYYDEYMGMTLIKPYCVFYPLGVEDATENGAYILEYCVSSDYGTEVIKMYFSANKILTAYSMQLE